LPHRRVMGLARMGLLTGVFAVQLAGTMAHAQPRAEIAAKAAEFGLVPLFPDGDILPTSPPRDDGFFRRYRNDAAVYWSPGAGAHMLRGPIWRKWIGAGAHNSASGFPISDETPTSDGIGLFNDFEQGAIYFTPCEDAFILEESVLRVWRDAGAEAGFLGYPLSDLEEDPRPIGVIPGDPPVHVPGGRISYFRGGSILRRPTGISIDGALRLRALTFNVQFRDPLADVIEPGWPNTDDRARAVGEAIARFDVVALNEAFLESRREAILAEAERHADRCGHRGRLPDGSHFDVAIGTEAGSRAFQLFEALYQAFAGDEIEPLEDSGLVLLSRFPVIGIGTHRFAASSGEDSVAAKGVLHAVLWRGGRAPLSDVIHLFATHLQADNHPVRDLQLGELVRFIDRETWNSRDAPVILLGDLNLDGGPGAQADSTSGYAGFLRLLDTHDLEVVDLWTQLHPGTNGFTSPNPAPERRIDYFFLSRRSSAFSGIEPEAVNVERFPWHHDGVSTLSDHNAVGARLTWLPRAITPEAVDTVGMRVLVAVTRLKALTTDSCNGLMDFYGDVSISPGFPDVGSSHRVQEGNDIHPTAIAQFVNTLATTTRFSAVIWIRDEDDWLCGGPHDVVDVNPRLGLQDLSLAIDTAAGTVDLLDREGRPIQALNPIGLPNILSGTPGDAPEAATITFVVLVQPVSEGPYRPPWVVRRR
jgi:endonuclease/exonuclease/phosphatase family metal-dependent hydrolase